MSTTRRCSRCGVEQPASAYCRDRGNADGLYAYCRPCETARRREYRVRRFGVPGRSRAEIAARHAQAVMLRTERRLSYGQIGIRLGMSPDAARMAVTRLRVGVGGGGGVQPREGASA